MWDRDDGLVTHFRWVEEQFPLLRVFRLGSKSQQTCFTVERHSRQVEMVIEPLFYINREKRNYSLTGNFSKNGSKTAAKFRLLF